MPRTNATNENPSDGMTWRARRLSLPLPDLPIIALKREEALLQGYLPFAGFFLPHEYPMLPGFTKDLESAKREYCIVRDLRWCKGLEIFAKNGNKNKYITADIQRTEDYKTEEATVEAVASGFHPPKAERPVGALAEGQVAGTIWDTTRTAKREGAKWWLETSESKAPEGEFGIRESEGIMAGGENP